ncbi:MAG: hypothetical protein JWM77_88 [Rhodospirillales bacterium]|nr:hypothetical protein [Rhodospirillales bacterium]
MQETVAQDSGGSSGGIARETVLRALWNGRVVRPRREVPDMWALCEQLRADGLVLPYPGRGDGAICLSRKGRDEVVKLFGATMVELPEPEEGGTNLPDLSNLGDEARLAAHGRWLRERFPGYWSANDELTRPESTVNSARGDEPVFIMRARDVVAPQTISWWIWFARGLGVDEPKTARAEIQRQAATAWVEKALPATREAYRRGAFTARAAKGSAESVLQRAHADEPVFVLRASDLLASWTVLVWARLAALNGAPADKVESAMEIARAMQDWTVKRLPGAGSADQFPDENG